jgi:hypothetical protein
MITASLCVLVVLSATGASAAGGGATVPSELCRESRVQGACELLPGARWAGQFVETAWEPALAGRAFELLVGVDDLVTIASGNVTLWARWGAKGVGAM